MIELSTKARRGPKSAHSPKIEQGLSEKCTKYRQKCFGPSCSQASPAQGSVSLADRQDFKGLRSQPTRSEQVRVIPRSATASPHSASALRALKVSAQDSHPWGCSQGEEEAATQLGTTPDTWNLHAGLHRLLEGTGTAEPAGSESHSHQPESHSHQTSLITQNFTTDFAVGLSQRGRCRQGLLSSESGHSAPFTAQWENFQFSGTLQPCKSLALPSALHKVEW